MDLIYLRKRRDASIVMARNAATEAARRIHLTLARAYSARLTTPSSCLALSRAAS